MSSNDTGNTGPTEASGPAAEQASAASPFKELLKGNTLVPLLLGGAAVIAVVAAVLLWASAPTYRVLFNNLGDADGGRIVNELESRDIPYQFGAGGQAILVPGDQVHRLRLQLAEEGLPQGGNVGFELMDDQDFGISQFAEQVNFQRSLEGELSSSIQSMNPVSQARVHLSMAKPSVFVRDHEPAKASVILTLHGGRTLSQSQVNAVMHLVSSSVPQLNPDDVTVVNQTGDLLSEASGDQQVDGEQLGYIQEVESRYQARIENILQPLFGDDNIRVQVAAQIDFSVREETTETFEPNQDPNEAAVRSTQLSGSRNGADALAGGIPGALSNTPPGWAPSPVNDGEAEQDPAQGDAAANPEAAEQEPSDNLRYDNVVNYEVDRNITHIQHQRGRIERLTVAAVINYRSSEDEEGNAVQVPLTDEEMEEVRGLVSQAMGFSAAREDQLEVVNSPFAVDSNPEPEQIPWWEKRGVQDMILTLSRYLLAGLLILALYRVILRPLLRRHLAVAPAPQPHTPVTGEEQPSPAREPAEAPRRKRERRASNYEEDLKEVRNLAKDDPRLIAMVVRSWMNKDGK